MVVNKGIRSGGRAKFGNSGAMRDEMNKALGNKPKGDVVEGEIKLTNTEATGQTNAEARDVVATPHHVTVTAASCVRALEKAAGFGRNAFRIEVAVSLAIFAASSTGADRATKRVVMGIYEQAGYDVVSTGRDYKTVNRRVNTFVDLFNKIGQASVEAAIGGMRDGKAIDRLCDQIGEAYNFNTINAVLEYVGKPVEQTNTPEVRAARAAKAVAENNAVAVNINERIETRRAERQKQLLEETDGIIVSSGPLSLVIPRDCGAAEVRAMAAKLIDFADRLDAEAGTPEEQRNSAMHH